MRQVCTKENPATKEGRWSHPEAVEVGEYDRDYGSFVKYECPVCGLRFEVELPD